MDCRNFSQTHEESAPGQGGAGRKLYQLANMVLEEKYLNRPSDPATIQRIGLECFPFLADVTCADFVVNVYFNGRSLDSDIQNFLDQAPPPPPVRYPNGFERHDNPYPQQPPFPGQFRYPPQPPSHHQQPPHDSRFQMPFGGHHSCSWEWENWGPHNYQCRCGFQVRCLASQGSCLRSLSGPPCHCFHGCYANSCQLAPQCHGCQLRTNVCPRPPINTSGNTDLGNHGPQGIALSCHQQCATNSTHPPLPSDPVGDVSPIFPVHQPPQLTSNDYEPPPNQDSPVDSDASPEMFERDPRFKSSVTPDLPRLSDPPANSEEAAIPTIKPTKLRPYTRAIYLLPHLKEAETPVPEPVSSARVKVAFERAVKEITRYVTLPRQKAALSRTHAPNPKLERSFDPHPTPPSTVSDNSLFSNYAHLLKDYWKARPKNSVYTFRKRKIVKYGSRFIQFDELQLSRRLLSKKA